MNVDIIKIQILYKMLKTKKLKHLYYTKIDII